ncbi:unnamed protein product [Bursaphelenchus xylophilus]|uniref:(pine wood nematode) hypothetical protein n=1 Tax=Bursaphelenchus xylophilus TaxID=6326 RepID=A0A1I7SR66_BURXY|nr:unnamed protein product [Bursaphelenchus xylophilus]CAG9110900.1 unnamed protein product [Bursaphelenchus xylophilus]
MLRSISFGPDFDCFCCATDQGLVVLNSDPLKVVCRVDFGGSLQAAEPIFRCSLVALVAGGERPAFAENKVLIYDVCLQKIVIELNLPSKVVGVKVNRHRIVIILEYQIQVFSFSDIPEFLIYFDTAFNPRGICELSHCESELLAFPSVVNGHVSVCRLNQDKIRTTTIRAHQHAIQALAANQNGSLIATASIKGTLVRVFNSLSGHMLYEFRRGSQNALISSINFSKDSAYLCVCSNHSTIHLFSLFEALESSLLKKFFTLKGRPSQIRIHLGNENKSQNDTLRTQAGFMGNSLVVVGADGSFSRYDRSTATQFSCEIRRDLLEMISSK